MLKRFFNEPLPLGCWYFFVLDNHVLCKFFCFFINNIFFILKIIYFVYTKISERRIESQVRKAIKFQTYHQRRSRFKRRTSAKEQKQYEMELGKVKKKF